MLFGLNVSFEVSSLLFRACETRATQPSKVKKGFIQDDVQSFDRATFFFIARNLFLAQQSEPVEQGIGGFQ